MTNTQQFPYLSARTMSSGEVTLNILKYPEYKPRTKDLEEVSDCEQWKRRVKSFVVKNR